MTLNSEFNEFDDEIVYVKIPISMEKKFKLIFIIIFWSFKFFTNR